MNAVRVSFLIATDVLGGVSAGGGFVFVVNATGSVRNGVQAGTDIGRRLDRDPDTDWRAFYGSPFSAYSWPDTWAPLGIGVIAQSGDVGGGVTAGSGPGR